MSHFTLKFKEPSFRPASEKKESPPTQEWFAHKLTRELFMAQQRKEYYIRREKEKEKKRNSKKSTLFSFERESSTLTHFNDRNPTEIQQQHTEASKHCFFGQPRKHNFVLLMLEGRPPISAELKSEEELIFFSLSLSILFFFLSF